MCFFKNLSVCIVWINFNLEYEYNLDILHCALLLRGIEEGKTMNKGKEEERENEGKGD